MSTFVLTTFVALVVCAIIAVAAASLRRRIAPTWALLIVAEAGFALVAIAVLSSETIFDPTVLNVDVTGLTLPVLFGLLLGAALLGALWALTLRPGRPERDSSPVPDGGPATFAVLLFVAFAVGLGAIRAVAGEPPDAVRTNEAFLRPVQGLDVADGFVVRTVVPPGTFTRPKAFAPGPDGAYFVSDATAIWLVSDRDHDGTLDEVTRWRDADEEILGLAFHDGALYASAPGQIVRYRDADGDGQSDGGEEVLASGFVANVYSVHRNNALLFDSDDRLYMAAGGSTNVGPENELLGGTILSFDEEGNNMEIFATGLRNSYDIDFCPDGRLFATDNGPERPDGFELAFPPPDELNHVEEGKDYGYPDVFGYPPPEAESEPPVAVLPYSGGATGVVCYDGDLFSAEYRDDVFVAQWGTFLELPDGETGRRVLRVELHEGDRVTGTVSEFLRLEGRPIDLLVDGDGSLLVLDYEAGQILDVSPEA